jgi:aspartate/methionine/tyrosine aminotransferase
MPIETESPEQLGYDTIANNLAESSVADQRLRDLGLEVDLGDLLLRYGDHLGHPWLRASVAGDGHALSPDDVLVTPGAAAALFCVATALLSPGDHAVIEWTNYATNLETPRVLGAHVDRLELSFETGYRVDLDRLAALLRPDTRLVSLTCPHNPTGTMLTLDELHAVVDLVERSGAVLLLDETYRELTHGPPLPVAATLSPQVISVASVSKAYGLPGLRVGWAICRDADLLERLLAVKEQAFICGATLDEEIAAAVVADRDRLLPPVRAGAARHRAIVESWLDADDLFEWVPPSGGVVCFPRIRARAGVDTDRFYRSLLAEHGTYVGPGHWFGTDDRNLRIGYGWPTTDELRAGLASLSAAARSARSARSAEPTT